LAKANGVNVRKMISVSDLLPFLLFFLLYASMKDSGNSFMVRALNVLSALNRIQANEHIRRRELLSFVYSD
jgi:hypothetical protein